jgi:hypothetical protein
MREGLPTFSTPSDSETTIPWWLWPNLLALDAPAVGVVWQRFLGSAFDVPIPVSTSVTLASIVWGVYLTDRWFDADPRRPPEPGDRHRFARRFRTRLGVTAVLVWALACGVTLFWLPGRYVAAGIGVATFVAAYFAVVHLARRGRLIAGGGKEAAVGVLFAAGVSVPLMTDAGPSWKSWVPSVAAFALLCWLNCERIARWETVDISHHSRAAAFLAVAICGLVVMGPLAVRMAVLASLTILGLIHLIRQRIGQRRARVLADVALLTPLARFLF